MSRTFTSRRPPDWSRAVLDQFVYSLSNLGLTLAVSSLAGPSELGALAVVLVFLQMIQRVAKAVTGDTALLLAASGRKYESGLRYFSYYWSATGAAVTFAMVFFVGYQWEGRIGRGLTASIFACVLAIVILQDSRRSSLLAASRYRRLLVIDAIWLIVVLISMPAVSTTNLDARGRTLLLFFLWGLGALISLLAAGPQAATEKSHTISEFSSIHRKQGWHIASETILFSFLPILVLWLLAFLYSDVAAGVFKLGESLFGLILIVYTGARPFYTKKLASQLADHGVVAFQTEFRLFGYRMTVAGALSAAALIAIAKSPFGDMMGFFAASLSLLVAFAIDRTLTGYVVALQTAVRAMGCVSVTKSTRHIGFAVGSISAVPLCLLFGALGGVASLVLYRASMIVGYQVLLRRLLSDNLAWEK